jgi:hypothetical protein
MVMRNAIANAVDPTNNSLEAALLDQKVAGTYDTKEYAYVAVTRDGAKGKPFGIGIAVLDEQGYTPIEGGLFEFDSYDSASAFANGMNKHIGLNEHAAVRIVVSTMMR